MNGDDNVGTDEVGAFFSFVILVQSVQSILSRSVNIVLII